MLRRRRSIGGSGFRSRELTQIIDNANAANLDVAAAVARIVQADAQSRITGAALLPTVDLNGNATHSRASQSTSGTSGTSFGGSERDNLNASLTASYEIDFWGKNRFALRAQEETAIASRFDRDVVALTTVVTAANAYFQVLAAQDRLRVARQNLVSAKRVGNLIAAAGATPAPPPRWRRRSSRASSTRSTRRSRRSSRRWRSSKMPSPC